MTTDNNNTKALYQNLGKLFYAVASVDGSVEGVEINTLKSIVTLEWKGSENAIAIIGMFDWLNNTQDYDANACFESFLDYMESHKTLFTNSLKILILKTAKKIAYSFSKNNKAELILLAQLNLALK